MDIWKLSRDIHVEYFDINAPFYLDHKKFEASCLIMSSSNNSGVLSGFMDVLNSIDVGSFKEIENTHSTVIFFLRGLFMAINIWIFMNMASKKN